MKMKRMGIMAGTIVSAIMMIACSQVEAKSKQIFKHEDEMLMSLQGSWAWQQDPFFLEYQIDKGKKRLGSHLPLDISWQPPLYRLPDGLRVSYLLPIGEVPTSVVDTASVKLLDIDMNTIQFDLVNNTLTVGSYYIDCQLVFHFLSKDSFWVEQRGVYFYLYVKNFPMNSDGEMVNMSAFVRHESMEEVVARYQQKMKEERSPRYQSNMLRYYGEDHIYERVEGYKLDKKFNALDERGKILMTPQQVRSSGHILPPAEQIQ